MDDYEKQVAAAKMYAANLSDDELVWLAGLLGNTGTDNGYILYSVLLDECSRRPGYLRDKADDARVHTDHGFAYVSFEGKA